MKKIILLITALSLLLSATAVLAADIRFVSPLVQGEFKDLSKEFGAALGYKNVAPPVPLGITGFDAGVELSFIDVKKESRYWRSAFGNDASGYLVYPRLRVRKGLPFGIDVGAMYSYVPDSNVKSYGFELSKAILEGGALSPALGVRATYTKLAGVSDLDLQTAGIDATISKGFAIITPYIGGGMLWIDSKAKGDLQRLSTAAGTPLSEEKIWLPRGVVGVKVALLPVVSVTAEAEYAVRPIYSLKAAIGF
ncbi:hypothetical protein KI809_04320 [Geobacter pelophilus]|jgi:hypothetical protein|uniref:Outer membrane protein n=1 Tax=Geoanaerobacter pelophilus TaxID=60036 RepID=A0AAW4L8K2_9BACT|nr:hypothetical protein [Geoanaerobacter pelophilus]MBT0663521.1 hypothetical protein [Geoanaerobacter pelophilus]